MAVQWDDTFRLGIPVIDAQHKRLILSLNEFSHILREGCSSRDVEEFLQRIEHYTVRHFVLEEKYMAESNYPGLEKQRQAHQSFISRLELIVAQFEKGGLSAAVINSLRHELAEWIGSHVTGLDLEFGAYYRRYQKELLRLADGG
jgi:hemerythrin